MELWQYIIGQLFVAGVVYGGIRSDIRTLYREVTEAKTGAHQAHQRIDQLLMKGKS